MRDGYSGIGATPQRRRRLSSTRSRSAALDLHVSVMVFWLLVMHGYMHGECAHRCTVAPLLFVCAMSRCHHVHSSVIGISAPLKNETPSRPRDKAVASSGLMNRPDYIVFDTRTAGLPWAVEYVSTAAKQ